MTTNIELRDYQESGVSGIRAEFRAKNDPVLYVLPAGGGKTYTFSYIADSAAFAARARSVDEYILIVVHRKELLLQASASLRALGVDHGLISPHFTAQPHKRIQVASIDTLLLRIKKRPIKVRLLIFDEGHHVVKGNKWGRSYEELGEPPTLLVTATPVRGDRKGLGVNSGGICKSMVEGPKPSELIRRGVLCRPVIYTSFETPDLTGLKKNKDGDYSQAALAERVDKPVITGSALEQWKKVCPGVKTVIFCVNVKHAQHVVDEFNNGGYRFTLLVGEPYMSDAERTAADKALRNGDIDGVCTVDLISEGYDLPNLACVIMLRPTESESLFIQQAWRGGRSDEGKEEWYLLDHVGNVGRIVDGEFKRKHGLPQEDRDWSLDGRMKKKGKKKDQDEPTIDLKQCNKCYVVSDPKEKHADDCKKCADGDPVHSHCGSCGEPFPVSSRSLEQVEGELRQVTEAMQIQMRQQIRSAQSAAKSVEDMMQQLGYSRGRAEAIVKAREEKSELRTGLIFDLREWRSKTGQDLVETFGVSLSDLKAFKPKALKELRDRFDAHRSTYTDTRVEGLRGELFSQPAEQVSAF